MSPSTFDIAETTKIRNLIIKKSKDLGFDVIGFANPKLPKSVKKNLDSFLNSNFHGEMDWLKRNQHRRESPENLWSDVKTVISLGTNYGPDENPLKNLDKKNYGNISVYAQGEDYHKVIKKNLKKFGGWLAEELNCNLKVFVDTAPIMEKNIAEIAGIGWQGKHSNIVSKNYGSWLFLSEIFLDIFIAEDIKEKDNCGSCKKCINICPTDAFIDKYKMDARKCISYLTIEHKSQIPLQYRNKIGNRIYGCDDCLAVCPWNKFASKSKEIKFLSKRNDDDLTLSKLSKLNDQEFRKFFSLSPIKRIGRDRFLRNVLIAIGNSNDKKLAENALNNLKDDSPLVRGAAVWAVKKLLEHNEIIKIKAKHIINEKDNSVIAEWDNNIS